jgi:16S rRNA (uracil1498-N3)-methyltransferase
MSIRRFFSPHPVINNHVLITGEELHHLKNVNRAKKGDKIEVINGKGALYFGNIRSLKDHEAIVEITGEERQAKPSSVITIAPSLTKKKAMNVMVEKLAEMGVDEIRPVIFARTDEKYSSSMLKKWQRIALQSLKVNKKLWPTQIYPPVNLRELTEIMEDIQLKFLLHVEGEIVPPLDICKSIVCVIGPPGDFVPEERERLLKKGFIQMKINDSILKTETAAISTAAILCCFKAVGNRYACSEDLQNSLLREGSKK